MDKRSRKGLTVSRENVGGVVRRIRYRSGGWMQDVASLKFGEYNDRTKSTR